jgi:hypothetical protein
LTLATVWRTMDTLSADVKDAAVLAQVMMYDVPRGTASRDEAELEMRVPERTGKTLDGQLAELLPRSLAVIVMGVEGVTVSRRLKTDWVMVTDAMAQLSMSVLMIMLGLAVKDQVGPRNSAVRESRHSM